MPRKGRTLEVLVKQLQEFLAPGDVIVRSPEEFRDSSGNKLGEIDVTLRGQFGSSRIFVGIECRDRPSDGAQGNDWISQIAGKRSLFRVDKMIAVSTTGFTRQAVEAANRLSVDLLHLENVDLLDLRDWFKAFTFIWTWDEYVIDGMVEISTLPRITTTVNLLDAVLVATGTGAQVSIDDCIRPSIDGAFATLPVGEKFVSRRSVIDVTIPLVAVIKGRKLKVTSMRMPVLLSRESVEATAVLNACHNISDGTIDALTGTVNADLKFPTFAEMKFPRSFVLARCFAR